jgi:hypothetical protein
MRIVLPFSLLLAATLWLVVSQDLVPLTVEEPQLTTLGDGTPIPPPPPPPPGPKDPQ